MNEIEMVDSGLPMARIAAIRVAGPSTLEITWAKGARSGRTDLVDLTPVIGTYKAYRPLRSNPKMFATAHLIEDGDAIAWDGLDVDMAAETIETLAESIKTTVDIRISVPQAGRSGTPAGEHAGEG